MSNDDPYTENFDQILDDDIPDASSASQHKKATNRKRQRTSQSSEFWSEILSTQLGRKELWEILQRCSTFETRFACGPSGFPSSEATWFQAGEQNIGLHLYHFWLMLSPEGVLQMLRENDSRFSEAHKPGRTKVTGG